MTEESFEIQGIKFDGVKIEFGPAYQDAIRKLIADEVASVQATMSTSIAVLDTEIASLELRIQELEGER